MSIQLHKGDLPADVRFAESVAIDTETLGLHPHRDPLCLVQLSAGDGTAHLVQLDRKTYDAPNLKAMLQDKGITKIFHYARFDVAVLQQYLGVATQPIWCTKIASLLARTYTGNHGLKDICKELLGVEISKQQQSSDWGGELSQAQQAYAASDVLHLHGLKEKLTAMLAREDRLQLAQDCFTFLPTRVQLDLRGWAETDIFTHSL